MFDSKRALTEHSSKSGNGEIVFSGLPAGVEQPVGFENESYDETFENGYTAQAHLIIKWSR